MVVASGSVAMDDMTEDLHAAGQKSLTIGFFEQAHGIEPVAEANYQLMCALLSRQKTNGGPDCHKGRQVILGEERVPKAVSERRRSVLCPVSRTSTESLPWRGGATARMTVVG